jgi:hypothetical protein
MIASILHGLLSLTAWIIATCGPAIIAVQFWKLAKRVRRGWLVHFLFVPLVLATEWIAVELLSFGSGDNGDGPPGLGLALIPAFLLLMLSVVAYLIALAVSQIQRLRIRA